MVIHNAVATSAALGFPIALSNTLGYLVGGWALPAALPTYLTALGLQAGALLGGAVLVEAIFSWPGLGQLAAQAIDRRDYPVVQACTLTFLVVVLAVNLVVDVACALLDPRRTH